jgi:hypothetical protein
VQHGHDVVEDALDTQRGLGQHELAGLDLGQLEDVVDDVEQVLAGRLELVQRSLWALFRPPRRIR